MSTPAQYEYVDPMVDSHNRAPHNRAAVARNEAPAPPVNIRFAEILSALIEQSPYDNHRRAIWEYAGVSSAALSQYVLGRARPRFETLCLLAEFFGVSLDYLVLGKERPADLTVTDERQSMAHYVDWTLADVRERTSAHIWFVSRIGQAVAEHIDAIAKDLLPDSPQPGDVLTDNDIVMLERLSTHSKMIAPNLDCDLMTSGDKVIPGRFARIAAANLAKGHAYEVLLPTSTAKSWNSVIHTYKKVLGDLGVPADKIKNYRFATTHGHFFTGVYLYKIDRTRLLREDPYLAGAVEPHINDDNWIGFARHEHVGIPGPGVLYNVTNLCQALLSFDQLWADSQRVAS